MKKITVTKRVTKEAKNGLKLFISDKYGHSDSHSPPPEGQKNFHFQYYLAETFNNRRVAINARFQQAYAFNYNNRYTALCFARP